MTGRFFEDLLIVAIELGLLLLCLKGIITLFRNIKRKKKSKK